MSNHELNGAREYSGQKLLGLRERVSTKVLAVVLSGAAFLGTAGCDGDTVPKEVRFAVTCSDPNNGNQAPEIDSIKQDSPYGEEATKRAEFVCPDGTKMSVHEVNSAANSTLGEESTPAGNSDIYTVTINASCSESAAEKPVNRAFSSRNGSGRDTFVVVLNSDCDINNANISK